MNAFETGFIKRAEEYGFSTEEASRLYKSAEGEEHVDWLKNILDKTLTHHTTGALLGGAAGATAGAIAGKKGKKLKHTLLGALAGAGAGTGATFAAPEHSKDLNEALITSPLRHGVGRVMTNILQPYGYDNGSDGDDKLDKLLLDVKKHGLLKTIKDVAHDKPIYDNNDYREAIWRGSFGEKARVGEPDADDSTFHKVTDKVWALKQPTKIDITSSDFDDMTPFDELQRDVNDLARSNKDSGDISSHGIMGHYHLQRQNNGYYTYKDPWDFDLHTGEHISQGKHINRNNLMRYLLDKIISPITVSGAVKPTIS